MYRFGLNSLLQDNAEAAFSDLLIEPSRFENSLSGTQFLYIHYSDDFFRYKKAGGGFHIEVNGVKLWLKGGLQLHIGDLCFEHEDQLEPALEEVRKRAAKAGFSEVIVQCNAQSPLEAYLSSRYALRPSFDVACSDIDGKSEMRFLRTNYGDFDTF